MTTIRRNPDALGRTRGARWYPGELSAGDGDED